MTSTITHPLKRPLALVAITVVLGACADGTPVAPDAQSVMSARIGAAQSAENANPIATIRRVTARYHDLDAALADGFVFLHGCEVRGDEGPVGELYVHFARLLDGVIDPASPDALLYQPMKNGSRKLIGVELAIPYPMWTAPQPPQFMGAEFQREDEFGVWGLHVWAWNANPEGMFAEANPNVSCGE